MQAPQQIGQVPYFVHHGALVEVKLLHAFGKSVRKFGKEVRASHQVAALCFSAAASCLPSQASAIPCLSTSTVGKVVWASRAARCTGLFRTPQ